MEEMAKALVIVVVLCSTGIKMNERKWKEEEKKKTVRIFNVCKRSLFPIVLSERAKGKRSSNPPENFNINFRATPNWK